MKKATYLNCNILANQTHPHFNPPSPIKSNVPNSPQEYCYNHHPQPPPPILLMLVRNQGNHERVLRIRLWSEIAQPHQATPPPSSLLPPP